ncbi:hypothetical protein CPT03_00630 [Pedobacter ginsengisoli]|uniref:Outer membrane protein beta-barrel domain-containing protein n=1 Tax=Pedobacter ginsengisoli TaxID=363852 RepID=A0A2D1U0D0_9SPHI|nr:hypothetical protein [Pedobacter ginsengisoli]ATP55075.1 hypothetical protein CPT03_00630 [Pedobacter ginsengisoli]
MNTLDDKLNNHIKAVFEEFDTEGADYGWIELRKNFPVKSSNRPLYFWLSGIAASLLVAGTFLFNTFNNDALKNVIQQNRVTKATPAAPQKTESNLDKSNAKKEIISFEKRTVSVKNTKKNFPVNVVKTEIVAVKITDTVPANELTKKVITPLANVAVAKPDTVKNTKPTTTLEFLQKESEKETKFELASTGKKATNRKNVLFDVYTATFLNYYADNPVKVNAGAGFNANIRINKSVYLSMGAGISETKITYQTTRPSSLSSYSNSAADLALMNGYVLGANSIKLNASFLNIDIPVAFKFYPGKSGKYYFSTGINSSTYLNQKYSSSITGFNPTSNSYSDFKGKTEESNFNGFDFANSAIFAIGINQPIGKSSTLTFEPFFKPSLRGYGDKDIKINTAGLNLKLSLGGKK